MRLDYHLASGLLDRFLAVELYRLARGAAAITLTTDRLPRDIWALDAAVQADAVDQYLAACVPFFDVELRDAPERFYNRTEGYNLPGVLFGRCETVAQRFSRTWTHIANGPTEAAQVILQLQGAWTGTYEGRTVEGAAGSIRFVDMARPWDLSTEAFQTLNLVFPRALLGDQSRVDLHGLVIPPGSVDGDLIAAQLRSLWDVVGRMSARESATAIAAAVALLSGVLAARALNPTGDAKPAAKNLLAAARRLVDAHLADPNLTPESLRKHLKVSRSQLYQAFEPVGGVAAFIQVRRLDLAFDALIAPDHAKLTLAEIAYVHGFRSDSHFSRSFRARFDIPPGRLRRLNEQGATAGLSIANRPQDVLAWIKAL